MLPLLVLLLGAASVAAANNPFVGCLNGDYTNPATWITPTVAPGETCVAACTKRNMRYSYYKAYSSIIPKKCMCSPSSPPYTSFVTSVNAAGDCSGEQWYTTMSDSSYTFLGCPSTLTPNTSPALVDMSRTGGSHYDCLKACYLYQQAFVAVGEDGVWGCFCSPQTGGTTPSGFDKCKVYNRALPRYYGYTHEPGVAANQASGFYRRQLARKERLERDEKELYAYCPKPRRACRIDSVPESFECIDPETELESCGGCIHGDYNGYIRNATIGTDCTAQPGIALGGTTCSSGRCVISACQRGWTLVDGRCI